jgi:hypothetical protein
MKFRFPVTLVVFAAALWTLQSAHVRTQQNPSAADVDDFQGRPAVAHEVLVRVRPGAPLGPLHALIDAVDAVPIGSEGWRGITSSSRGIVMRDLMTRLAGLLRRSGRRTNYIVHDRVPNDRCSPICGAC